MKAILAAVLLVPALVQAQTSVASVAVPNKLPYQGRLLKADGSPETGTLTLTFTIYDGGGSQAASKWSEQQTVILTNGFYAVFLGSHTALPGDLFDGHERWLGIKVQGDTAELSPRHFVGSIAYAITATNALTATTANQVAPAAVGTPQLADGAVTNSKQNFGTPVNPTDVATKAYADGLISGRVVSGGSPSSYTGSTTPVDVYPLTVTVMATGRPVILSIQPSGQAEGIYEASGASGWFGMVRDSTEIARWYFSPGVWYPCSLTVIDAPASGSHTYKLQAWATTGGSVYWKYIVLAAVPL